MKTVKTCSNLAEAGFAHSLLEAARIPAFMADELTFALGYQGHAVGARVENADRQFDYRRFYDPFGKESERIPFLPQKP